jgi:hypothetical protein
MERGPIPLKMHAMLEPFMALLIIASPWIFGFSDVDSATTLAIVVGLIMLVGGAITRWRWSLAKVLPLRMHAMTDMALGALLILSPFIFGFSDEGGATRWAIIVGVLELMTALGTRWDPAEADDGRAGSRHTAAA